MSHEYSRQHREIHSISINVPQQYVLGMVCAISCFTLAAALSSILLYGAEKYNPRGMSGPEMVSTFIFGVGSIALPLLMLVATVGVAIGFQRVRWILGVTMLTFALWSIPVSAMDYYWLLQPGFSGQTIWTAGLDIADRVVIYLLACLPLAYVLLYGTTSLAAADRGSGRNNAAERV